MNQHTLLKFKAIFEKQKQELLYSNQILNQDFFVDHEEIMDEVDKTSTEMEQAMRMRLRNREALYFKKIEAALERIKKGTFGQCVECDEGIEIKRLEARPTTTLCLSCKEEGELKEKSFADGNRSKSLGLKLSIPRTA